MADPLEKVSARERNRRWKNSHQEGIRERAAMLEQNMSPEKARRQAARQQEAVTNQARAQTEGRK